VFARSGLRLSSLGGEYDPAHNRSNEEYATDHNEYSSSDDRLVVTVIIAEIPATGCLSQADDNTAGDQEYCPA